MSNFDNKIAARSDSMQIHLKSLDTSGSLIFEGCISVDPVQLMVLAESHEELARAKGRTFTEGAVPFWASELLKAAMQGSDPDELHRLSFNVAMATWLVESIYGGLSAADFMRSNLHFTQLPSGAVKFDRIKIDCPSGT